MLTHNPLTDKPVPQSPGTGKLGLGYGLLRNTPGLPVQNPKSICLANNDSILNGSENEVCTRAEGHQRC